MGTHAKVKGFTLIEMLIALAIFGMVVGIASYGFSLFSRHWEGRLGRFQQSQDQLQRLDLVVAALENTLPYVVRDASGAPGFYFLGREEGLTLLTMNPVFAAGSIAVIRVFREPAGNGKWNLLYEEAPLAGQKLRLASQVLPFSHRMIVLRDVPDLGFRYFGWRSLERRVAVADAPELGYEPEWATEFDGLVLNMHPQRIALRIGDSEAVVFVPERADVTFRRFVDSE
jgi:prepilin-type N-terminal cleavage/methylation domain-containing protein